MASIRDLKIVEPLDDQGLKAALKTHALHTLARHTEVPPNARSVWTAARLPPLW